METIKMKVCSKCNRELPENEDYFAKGKGIHRGELKNYCRQCDHSYGRFKFEPLPRQKKWTDEERELLKQVYPYYTNKELVEKFFPDRTIRSIDGMAYSMGVPKKTDGTISRGKYSFENAKKGYVSQEQVDKWRRLASESHKKTIEKNGSYWTGRPRSEESKRKMSRAKKAAKKWVGEDNPRHKRPLYGQYNGRWKGGILNTYLELRSDTKDWQTASMEYCGYHCVITGGEFDNVHHIYPFRNIVDSVFPSVGLDVRPQVSDYTEEEFDLLRAELKRMHATYGFGACLNKDVHKLFHDTYGYTKFTKKDFLDFVDRIKSGEFDSWFLEHNLKINICEYYIEYLEIDLEAVA